MQAKIAGIEVTLDYLIKTSDDHVLMAAYYHSSVSKINCVGSLCGMESMQVIKLYSSSSFDTKKSDYRYYKTRIGSAFNGFYYGTVVDKTIGKDYILSTKEFIADDYYQFLMNNFPFPLMEEWKDYLLKESLRQGVVTYHNGDRVVIASDLNKEIYIGSRKIRLADICVYRIGISDNLLKSIISSGLKKKIICISPKKQQPLKISGLDDYMMKYGKSISESLDRDVLRPQSQLKKTTDGLALKSIKLRPQQAACTNGMIAARENGFKFCLSSEEMGCGKTIQALSTVEGYYNQKWLKQHPGKTLKDCFISKEVSYRVEILCPTHLLDKWEHEILSQIPGAVVHQVTTLSQLIELKKRRKLRQGKEFYIFSKDWAKGDTIKKPVPTRIGSRYIAANICMDCLNASVDDGNEKQYELLKKKRPFYKKELGNLTIVPMKNENGRPVCRKCNGHNGHVVYLEWYGKKRGMVCPNCDNLLTRPLSLNLVAGRVEDEEDDFILQPEDFARKVQGNDVCNCCYTQLWENDVKPLSIDIYGNHKPDVRFNKKWKKIKFFSNFAQKKKGEMDKSAYCMVGRENLLVQQHGVGTEWVDSAKEYGPRRYPAARFCKKYLKNAFDIMIADEAHLYEGIGTAQGIAMHALTKCSKFVIPMTGTLCNGTALSFFSLFFMLMPSKMIQAGYSYNRDGMLLFCKKYGVVETTYEVAENSDLYDYNASGRGRQLTSPTVKAGVSLMLYIDFLLENSVMLNICDLAKYMPQLKEFIREIELPSELKKSYNESISGIKEALKNIVGKGLQSTMLQFALSYPDKPYGRSPIYSMTYEDVVVVEPENLKEFEDINCLLPKEKELVEIINKEREENRDCFVYFEYSGKEETNISDRLVKLIEQHCNLKGGVELLDSKSVKPKYRENYIKKRSDKVHVWVTNYRNVETGIDFVGEYRGRKYNYPTIIYVQMGTNLSSVWQSSRRHYRLNQTKECRTYYLFYKGTLQSSVLELMAEKISSASAIQGNFSESALESMRKTEDPISKLAKKLLSGKMADGREIENLLAQTRKNMEEDCDESNYIDGVAVTFYEVMGKNESDIFEELKLQVDDKKEKDIYAAFGMDQIMNHEKPDNSEEMEDGYKELLAFASRSIYTESVAINKKRRKHVQIYGQSSFF